MPDPTPVFHLTNGYALDLFQSARLVEWLDTRGEREWLMRVAADELGFTYVMIRYIAGIADAMGLVDARRGSLHPLGKALRQVDPYLTHPVVPWIIHFNLGANPRHLVWHRMACSFIRPRCSFGQEDARLQFLDLGHRYRSRETMSHVAKEVAAFLQAYTEGALTRLAYLEERDGEFVAPSMLRVPPPAFGYSLLTFAARYRAGETAIAIGDIAGAPSSPGRIFLMREPDVRAHLERMHRDGTISIESKGHLDQVRFANPPEAAEYLRAHFEDTED